MRYTGHRLTPGLTSASSCFVVLEDLMNKVGFVLTATAVSSVLLISLGCTSKVTEVTSALEDASTNLPSSSSGSSGHHSSGSSSSGGSTSSSGGSTSSSRRPT